MADYRDIISARLPDVLQKFSALSTELYKPVSKYCLEAFCIGLYVGASTTERLIGIFPPRPDIELDPQDLESTMAVSYHFADMGLKCGRIVSREDKAADPQKRFLILSEAMEFVSEKLGCKDHCAAAEVYLLGPRGMDPEGSMPS